MIHVVHNGDTPVFLKKSKYALSLIKKLREFYHRDPSKRKQDSFEFPAWPQSFESQLLDELFKVFNRKCCYCESSLSGYKRGMVEFFRPKRSAIGLDKESFSADHYWWLYLDWRNLYLACPICNSNKANYFPLEGQRAKIEANFDEVLTERNLIIDPCHDIPEHHFKYKLSGSLEPWTDHGKLTLKILKLNRPDLMARRKKETNEFLADLKRWYGLLHRVPDGRSGNSQIRNFNKYAEKIFDVCQPSPTQSFVFAKRYVLFDFINDSKRKAFLNFTRTGKLPAGFSFIRNTRTKDVILENFRNFSNRWPWTSDPKEIAQANRITTLSDAEIKNVAISRIEIKNFKSITAVTYDIKPPDPEKLNHTPWFLLLGENGVGKSSSLQAIALALSTEQYRKRFPDLLPVKFLRKGSRSGYVKIFFGDEKKPLHFKFTSKSFSLSATPDNMKTPPVTVLAYGSTRLWPDEILKWEEDDQRTGRDAILRIRNLFKPSSCLYDSERWLLETYTRNREDFNFAARAIKSLIDFEAEIDLYDKDKLIRKKTPAAEGITLVRKQDEKKRYRIFVKREEEFYLFEQLSDGYQSVIALSIDIMRSLMVTDTDMQSAAAIVLIDEIGTHLHPRWRMRVVSSLRKAFPRVQFIVTTHDPLCLKGLEKKEVVVLKNEGKLIVKLDDLPDPSSYRADQLLTSEFFGLNSTIDPATEKKFTRFYYLKGLTETQRKRKESNKDEMMNLETELRIQQADSRHLGDSLREELVYHVIDELLASKLRNPENMNRRKLKEKAVERVKYLWQTLDKQNK